jgi:hypothetical protein
VEDLILRARLGILEQNLEKVQDMMRAVQQRRTDIDTLAELLFDSRQDAQASEVDDRNLRQSLQDVSGELNKVLPLLENELEAVYDGDIEAPFAVNLTHIRQALQYVESARQRLWKAQFTIKKVRQRFFQIDEKDLIEFNSFITPHAAMTITEIKRLQSELDKADSADTTALKEVWNGYGRLLQQGEPLFNEYVDLWGGLALRDMNFDEGVCQMADEIIDKCNMVASSRIRHSLAIPARAEATRMTLARVIRLGFPEWTLWAVPLAAHEFGHVIADRLAETADLRPYMDQTIRNRYGQRYLDDLFADIFATYALGPAYACATILMRLDPRQAVEDMQCREGDEDYIRPAHAKRAYVVLDVLERVDAKNPLYSAFSEVIERLREVWKAALMQVEHDGSLEKTQSKELEAIVTFTVENFLDIYASGVMYDTERWASRSGWPAELNSEGGAERLQRRLEGDEQLRDVLNAAWVSRVMQPNADVARIGREAEALWEAIYSPPRGVGGPSDQRFRR